MRFPTAFALGLVASSAGLVGLATAPAVAAKKKEEAAAPKASYSKEFVAVAGEMEKASNAKDYAALKAAIDKSAPAATSPDDKFLLSYFKYQLSAGNNDVALQKEAVNGMLQSGKAPADLAPKLYLMAGQFALQGGDVDGAISNLEQAGQSLMPEGRYLLAESYFSKAVKEGGGRTTPQSQPLFAKGIATLQGAIDEMKAAGKSVPASWYARGAEVGRVIGSPQAAGWALEGVKGQGSSPKAWNVLLSGFQDANRNLTRGENLDILRLKTTTSALVSPAEYAEYVDAALKSGLVGEVKAMIERGRAAGVLTPANLSDYYAQASQAIKADRASLPTAEAQAAKGANGKIAAATADAYLGYGDNAKAIPLYRLALEKGGVNADEVNTRLGIALARSGDLAGAKTAFAAVATGARKQIAEYWTAWVDSKPA